MTKGLAADSRSKTLELLDQPDPDDKIQREFLDYHHENPHVYKFLVHYALQAVKELERRNPETAPQYSISAVVERVRWHVNFEVKGYPDFKIDNDFRSRYSRLIMKTVPALRGVFTLRKIRSSDLPSTPEIISNAIQHQHETQRSSNGTQQ